MFTDLKIPAGRRPLTQAEARISAATSIVITLLFLAAILDQYTPQKLSILFYFLFWIPMLAVHELGHAVVAKALGWRVREIVIGFGRTLWQWQIGETVIKLKLAPVEGYVLPAPVEPRKTRLKSALIYAAGPAAEFLVLIILLLAFGWDTVFNSSDQVSLIALKTMAVVIIVGAGFNLLPFRSEGAVSDGLGIISSAFITDEAIETRLLTFELREIESLLEKGRANDALLKLTPLLERFPKNLVLQLAHGTALSLSGREDDARDYIRQGLARDHKSDSRRREWLRLQAQTELYASDPEYLTLDLALQKALAISPGAADLLATKGASLVKRGRNKEGGDILEQAWRSNDGNASDGLMLAYLAIAAKRIGALHSYEHFRLAFEQVNRSSILHDLVVGSCDRREAS
jgi:tetratricopeptide (TPR) repeat protein